MKISYSTQCVLGAYYFKRSVIFPLVACSGTNLQGVPQVLPVSPSLQRWHLESCVNIDGGMSGTPVSNNTFLLEFRRSLHPFIP